MNILIAEVKNCLYRREIHVTFLILFTLSISGFIIECIAFFGSDLKFVRSASESSLFQGTYADTVMSTLIFILPLIAAIIYADSFYTDYHNGTLKVILTKINKSKYIIYKAIVVFSLTFITFFITLFISQVLSSMTFPSIGFDNMYALPPYDIGVQNYDETYFLDLIRLESPFLFNLISIINLSIFAGLFSLFTFGLFFNFLSKDRIFSVFFSFLVYIGINLIVGLFFSSRLTLFNQLNPIHDGSLLELIIWGLIILVVSIYLIVRGTKQEFIN